MSETTANRSREGLREIENYAGDDPRLSFALCEKTSGELSFGSFAHASSLTADDVANAIRSQDSLHVDRTDIALVDACLPVGDFKKALSGDGADGLAGAIRTFLENRMDPVSLAALNGVGREAPTGNLAAMWDDAQKAASYLSGGDRQARREALLSYPFSMPEMIEDPDVVRDIDARRSPETAIREKLGMDEDAHRTFRRIERVAAGKIVENEGTSFFSGFRDWRSNVMRAKIAASRIHHDKVPENWDDISAMMEAVTRADRLPYKINCGNRPVNRFLSRYEGAQWQKAPREIAEIDIPHSGDYISDISKAITAVWIADRDHGFDMARISSIASNVWSEKDVPEEDARYLSDFLKDTRNASKSDGSFSCSEDFRKTIGDAFTIKSLKELTVRWHHNENRLTAAKLNLDGDISWTPLVGKVRSGSGRVRELSGSRDLREQGRHEQHCVGSYLSRVMSNDKDGADFVFSIETAGGDILSTAHMSAALKEKGRPEGRDLSCKWSCIQHLAARNQPPTQEAQEVFEAFTERLRRVRPRDVQSYIESSKKGASLKVDLDETVGRMGWNVTDPGMATSLLSAYRDVLPKPFRDKSPSDLKEMFPAREDRPPSKRSQHPAQEILSPAPKISPDWMNVILRDTGVAAMEATFSGCGDSGDLDEITLFDAKGGDITNAALDELDKFQVGYINAHASFIEHLSEMAFHVGDFANDNGGWVWMKCRMEKDGVEIEDTTFAEGIDEEYPDDDFDDFEVDDDMDMEP